VGVGLESPLLKVMKDEVRDYDVEFFCGRELEYVLILENNPVREAKSSRVLIRPLGAGIFEAGMFERVNSDDLRVFVEFSTGATQESKSAAYIENPQHFITPKRKRSESIGEHGLYYNTYLLRGRRRRMVVSPKIWFLRFVSLPRGSERTQSCIS